MNKGILLGLLLEGCVPYTNVVPDNRRDEAVARCRVEQSVVQAVLADTDYRRQCDDAAFSLSSLDIQCGKDILPQETGPLRGRISDLKNRCDLIPPLRDPEEERRKICTDAQTALDKALMTEAKPCDLSGLDAAQKSMDSACGKNEISDDVMDQLSTLLRMRVTMKRDGCGGQ